MLGRAMVSVVLALGWAGAADAASFDCRKAGTAHERHICSTPALDAADTRLGQTYRAAAAAFPIAGFVLAVQRRFLASFPSCEQEGDAACLAQLSEQTEKLASLQGAAVYYGGRAGQPFVPDDVLFWVARRADGTAALHVFGGFMPDMNRPAPFPDGYVCDESFEVRPSGADYLPTDAGVEIRVRPERVVSHYMCSARNGAAGEYRRVR